MIRLMLKQEPPVRVSLSGIVPENLAQITESEIARRPLLVGKHRAALGDWFSIHLSGDAEDLVIEGSCGRFDHIGAGMSRGSMIVAGDAGAYLGFEMSGGRISVEGSVEYGAATAMKGGEMRIRRDAGEALGGAVPGGRQGMRGGIVLVGGSAAVRCGDRLRLGTIAIAGDVGACCGARMLAGTIVVGGRAGRNVGVAMRNGTIVALGGAEAVLPSFVDSGLHDLVFLRLLARALAAAGAVGLADRVRPLRNFRGDLSVHGRGELFVSA